MLANAVRLCDAKFGNLFLRDGDVFRIASPAQHTAGLLPSAARTGDSPPRRIGAWPHVATRKRSFTSTTSPRNVLRRRDPRVVALVGRPDSPRRADAQGQRADRRNRHLPPGGAPVHRQADRAGAATSPPRPSSLSRTPVCSTSCANRCSSRPPPPTCSR